MNPVGLFFVRVALFATEKGKLGREGKAYSLKEVQALFLKSVSGIVGRDVACEKWGEQGDPASSANPPMATTEVKQAAASLSDHSDPVWIAGQAG